MAEDAAIAEESNEAAAEMPVAASGEPLDLEVVHDIPLHVSVVLGKTKLSIAELLALQTGSVVELERNIGEPVDVYVNNRLVAKGEVVIVDNHIGITMTEMIKIE